MGLNNFKKKLKKFSKTKKKIFVLGRGFSTSFFLKNIKNYKKNLIIGFNTNEIIDNIDFYLTNKNKEPNNLSKNRLLKLKEIIKHNKSNDKIYKVGSTNYSIDPFLFFVNKTFERSKKKIEVVFVGFDFRKSQPESDYKKRKIKNIIQDHIDVFGQRDLFFKKKSSYKNLKIVHAGFDFFSDRDPRENLLLNKKDKKSFKVKIVAEITTNHHGETKKIIDLMNGAKIAGADYVKFQIRDVETFYPREKLEERYISPFGNTFRDYRNQLELSDDQIKLILKHSKKIHIKPFFSVLDKISFERLKKFKFDLLKIPSTISEDKNFLRYMRKNYKGKLVISTGMTKQDYLLECAKLFKKNKKLYLMHCISSYPTSSSDINIDIINSIKNLSKKYKNIIPGYSSHDLTDEASSMAIACGARLLEKHVKMDSKKWAHFDETALDIHYEFPLWVRHVRSAENILGTETKKIYKSEHHKYHFRKN